jgi:hypothetical protein
MLTGSVRFGVAQSPTSFSGIIFTNTTWTRTQSPINITGPAAIATGVTLTIQPGVEVDFNIFTFQVNGTFNAVGTTTDPITLNGGYHSRYPVFASEAHNGELVFTDQSVGWNSQTGTGSIIQYVNVISLTIATTVTLKIDRDVFSGAYADDGIDVVSGASTITNNIFNGAAIGVSGGSPTIFNNTIQGFGPGGGLGISISGGSPQILNNVLYQGYTGISIDGRGVDATIKNNVIANYTTGFFTYGYNTLTFEGNLLLYDTEGLLFSPYGTNSTLIEYNTIAYSNIALSYPPLPITFSYNNLEKNAQNIVLSTGSNLDATNNWWGTTDLSAISQTIHDYKNDYNLGNVTFTPLLTGPSSQAPSISSFSLTNQLPISTPTYSQNPASPPPTSNSPTYATASPKLPSQPTPTATPQIPTGKSTPSQNQLYDVIAVLVAVIVALIIVLTVVLRKRRVT